VHRFGFTYVGYTGVWNICDYSASTFPTGMVVDASLDVKEATYTPRSKLDRAIFDACASKASFPVSSGADPRALRLQTTRPESPTARSRFSSLDADSRRRRSSQ